MPVKRPVCCRDMDRVVMFHSKTMAKFKFFHDGRFRKAMVYYSQS